MSESCVFFLADAFTDQVHAATHASSVTPRDFLIAATVALGLGLLLFAGVYLHYRKKRDAADQQRLEPETAEPASDETEPDSEQRRRRRKRRRRRDHRPRNPSLHDTGGLPPPRPDGELPKY